MHIVRSGSDLPPADPATPVIVQRFVEGQEYSSCTIARDGRVVATMVYRGTVMAGSVAISFERVEHPAISGWIDTFVNASGWTGFIAFDFIVDAAGTVRAIECNPRATGGLTFWEAEDIARAVLNPADTAPVRVRPQRQLQQFYCVPDRGAMSDVSPPGIRGAAQTAVFNARCHLGYVRSLAVPEHDVHVMADHAHGHGRTCSVWRSRNP